MHVASRYPVLPLFVWGRFITRSIDHPSLGNLGLKVLLFPDFFVFFTEGLIVMHVKHRCSVLFIIFVMFGLK